MNPKNRPDPTKRRISHEQLRSLTVKRLLGDGKEIRSSIAAKFRGMNQAERKMAISSVITSDIVSAMDQCGDDNITAPSYNSIVVNNLDWEDFLSTEEYAELYEEIEAALLAAEDDPEQYLLPPPQSPEFHMADDSDDIDINDANEGGIIVCPFCW